MINLREYTSPVHKVEFEEGEIFIKRLSSANTFKFDAMKETGDRIVNTVLHSLCDEDGSKLDYNLGDIKKMDSDLLSTIFMECQIINKPKKKLDLVQES